MRCSRPWRVTSRGIHDLVPEGGGVSRRGSTTWSVKRWKESDLIVTFCSVLTFLKNEHVFGVSAKLRNKFTEYCSNVKVLREGQNKFLLFFGQVLGPAGSALASVCTGDEQSHVRSRVHKSGHVLPVSSL